MEIIFNDDPATKITLENGVPDGGMEKVTLEQPMENVTKIEFPHFEGLRAVQQLRL